MVEQIFTSVFGAIGQVTGILRGLVNSIAPEYTTLILLGLSLAGGYYLNKKYPNLNAKVVFVLYGLIIFLILRFV